MLTLSLLVALATGQVAQVCGPGKNCRATNFTATTTNAGATALSIPTISGVSPFIYLGVCPIRTVSGSLQVGNDAACPTIFTGATSMSTAGINLGTASTSFTLAVPSAIRGLAADTTSNRLWRSDTLQWRDVQSGPHPVLDSALYWYSSDLGTSGAQTWRSGAPRLNGADVGFTTVAASTSVLNGLTDYQTSAVIGNQAHHSTAAFVRRAGLPRWSWRGFIVPGTQRTFAGLSSALPVAAGSSTPTTTGVLFRVLNNGNFFACSANAAALTCTDTGVVGTSFSERRLEIDCRETSACTFWVDGRALVRLTTNLPATTVAMGSTVSIETTIAAAISFQSRRAAIETGE